MLESEEDFPGLAIDHFAGDRDAGRAPREAGDAAEVSCGFGAGMNRSHPGADQQCAGTSGTALRNGETAGRFFAHALSESGGDVAERIHHGLVRVVFRWRELGAFAADGRDDNRSVVREGKGLHDLDVVEVMPILVFARRIGGAASAGGEMK